MTLIILGKPNIVIKSENAVKVKNDIFNGVDLHTTIQNNNLKPIQEGTKLHLCDINN